MLRMFSLPRLAVALLALVALASCSKPAAPAGSGTGSPARAPALKIGMSFQELDNPYFAVMKQAFDEAGSSIGAEVFVTDARHDLTKQISDIEDLVQRRIDILLLNPTDSVGVEGAVREAKNAGVIVVAV